MPHLINLVRQAKIAIKQSHDLKTLEAIRVTYLGKKGYFTQQITTLGKIPPLVRPKVGARINQAKQQVQQAIAERKRILEQAVIQANLVNETIDVSLPGRQMESGSLHPVSHIINRIEYLFSTLGFMIVTGPEIEDDYHNFDALNMPPHHPARTEQDTFWFDNQRLLRTHTSGVQIRMMHKQSPPIRLMASGRVYRKDYDQTHTPMFHQMEGLVIDTNISFTHLKSMLYDFLYHFFDAKLQIRFRPSFFPFTEPSAEVDILDKHGVWLEVIGCGMVHTKVLGNVGINSEIYSGFSFGIGIERLTMLYYNITDLRLFFENNLSFLKQFK